MLAATPEEIPARFAEAWAARDADMLAALFDETADFVNVVGIWWEDRAAIRRAHHYALTSFFAESRLSVGRVKVRHLGDVAVIHARFSLTGQKGPDGAPAGRRATLLTFVARRRGDGWSVVSAQNTEVVPGAESFSAGPDGPRPADYRKG